MDENLKTALREYLLAMADDELIQGHRNSEWCGQAPILEEDIAFANLALDEIGHAQQWLELNAGLAGDDPAGFADRMIYWREPDEYRCAQMVELPNGDWAFSMLRQYFFDAAEAVRLEALSKSAYAPLAETAAKIRKEEVYHLRHTQAWVRRLGLGTDESHGRMQSALDQLWPYTGQLLSSGGDEARLVEAKFVPPGGALQADWEGRVRPLLEACELVLPTVPPLQASRSQHTPHLKTLLEDMQSVARLEPEADW